jgi:hypothetical protein
MCKRPDGWMPDKTLNAASKRKAGIPNKLRETNKVRIAGMAMDVKVFGDPSGAKGVSPEWHFHKLHVKDR